MAQEVYSRSRKPYLHLHAERQRGTLLSASMPGISDGNESMLHGGRWYSA